MRIELSQKTLATASENPRFQTGARVRLSAASHPILGPGEILEVDQGRRAYLVRFQSVETPRTVSFRVQMEDTAPHHSFLTAARQAPKAVGCLLTALEFHGLTTQLPREVWLALDGTSHQPVVQGVKVHFHRFTGDAFHEGIEVHAVAGGTIRVYGVTKTIIDCFRLRSKVGTDVAIEALRDGLRRRKTTLNKLDELSRRLRIHTVMNPYLEMAAAS